jgi:hypothetical protein
MKKILTLALIGPFILGHFAGLTSPAFGTEPIVQNVFTPKTAITSSELARRKAQLDVEYFKLNQLEERYLESYRKLEKTTATPETLTARTENLIEELGQADVRMLTGDKQARALSFLSDLDVWFTAQETHHALIDELNIEKFNYFIKEARYYSDVVYQDLVINRAYPVSERQIDRLRIAHDNLVAKHAEYLGHLDKYGTPKDTFRLAAIRDVFAETKNYFKIIDDIRATPTERLTGFIKKLAGFPKRFWEKLKYLAVLPDALQLGSDILLKGGGKINNTVNSAFLKAARIKGYSVEIKGRENLAIATTAKEKKTINIIAKVHRGPVLDNMVLAELGLRDYVFVTSFGSVIPEFYSSRLVDNPGLAFVGPGFPNGIETLLKKGTKNPEHIMVNYAEGSIGNLGETRPIATKFSTAVIPAFREKGYKVNVIPVTSQTASYLKKDLDPTMVFGKAIEARVHTPISDSMITFLESSGRLDRLGIFIRSTWLSELATDVDSGGKLIEGALTIRGMEEMNFKYMNLRNSEKLFCPRLFSRD